MQDRRSASEIVKKVRKIEIRTRHLLDDSLAGSYKSVFKGKGINFEEVREYIAGDDIRTIDWNVTARTSIPHIKKFTEERELTVILLIDISSSENFGSTSLSKREFMAELAAVLAFSAIANKDKVGLVLFTGSIETYIPAGGGRQHILRIIREILYFDATNKQTDILQALDFTNNVIKSQSVTFLISDFCLSGDYRLQLQNLKPKLQLTKRRHDLIALIISDPREYTLPDVGWITLEDAENGEQVTINTSSPKTRENYHKLAKEKKKLLLKTLNSTGTASLALTTDRGYIIPLRQFFKKRQRKNL